VRPPGRERQRPASRFGTRRPARFPRLRCRRTACGSGPAIGPGTRLAVRKGGPSETGPGEEESIVPKTWRPALAALAFVAATASASGTQEFQIIVHPAVQGTKISRANLSALFTGRTSRWGDKAEARPEDQSVLGYVASHEGAIGDAGPDTVIPGNVKVLAIVD
jgi:hypothetical protein